MPRKICYECPAGCDFCVSGGRRDVVPLLWDHLVMVHHEDAVSANDVLNLALSASRA